MYIFRVITCSLLLGIPVHVTQAASLSDALIASYKNNPSLKAERSNLKATDENASQAFSGFLPTASFTKERGRESGHFGTRPEAATLTDNETFQLSQPLFKGGETISQVHRANNLIKAARYTLQLREQQVLLDAVTAYMDVVRDEKVLKISKNNEEVLQKHLQATQERFELGEVTRTDVAQSEARLSRATSDRILAEGQLEASRATYKRVILENPVAVSSPKNIPDVPNNLDKVLSVAFKQSPALLKSTFDEKTAKNEVGIFTARLLPDASLNVTSRRDAGGISFAGSELDSDAVTVRVTVPLYQSGAEYSRIRQAKQTESARRYDVDNTRNTVRENAIRAWQQLQVTNATIKSSESTVRAAKVALDGVQQEADVGSRTTLDVLDAEQELFVAKTDLVRAKHNQVVATYSLLGAMGQLTASSLGLKVETYDPVKHYEAVRYRPFGLGVD